MALGCIRDFNSVITVSVHVLAPNGAKTSTTTVLSSKFDMFPWKFLWILIHFYMFSWFRWQNSKWSMWFHETWRWFWISMACVAFYRNMVAIIIHWYDILTLIGLSRGVNKYSGAAGTKLYIQYLQELGKWYYRCSCVMKIRQQV